MPPAKVFTSHRGRLYQPAADSPGPEISRELSQTGPGVRGGRGDRNADAADFAIALTPLRRPVGTPLAIAAVVRGLFGAAAES